MPGKSRQRKGKYSAKARKYNTPSQPTQPAQVTSQAQEHVPASAPAAPVRARRTAVMPESFVVENPYVVGELRSIGILAVLVIVILIVLAVIIS